MAEQQDRFQLMLLPESALAKRAPPRSKKHGYAALPGTGPTGETCGSCDHLVHKVMGKTYLKCGLMQAHWTSGYGTDVLARAPACRNWEAITK